MSYIVYKHTSPSGKVYIGMTCMKSKERWKNGNGYGTCRLFKRAIQKYGWESFEHEILFSGLTKEEAEAKEIEMITVYKATDKKHGYNIEKGGMGNGKHSEETLWKMSENRKGKCVGKDNPFYNKHHSKEWIRTHLCGENNPMYGVKGKDHPRYGIKHTAESIAKMSASKKGKKTGDLNPRAIKVMCVETGEVFTTIREASKKYGIVDSCISSVIHGRTKTAAGLHWVLIDKVA